MGQISGPRPGNGPKRGVQPGHPFQGSVDDYVEEGGKQSEESGEKIHLHHQESEARQHQAEPE
jgi:hypothetical protein